MLTLYVYKFKVQSIVDGDTIRGEVDWGDGLKKNIYIRFHLTEAPPIETPEGQKSKEYLESLISPNQEIIVETIKKDKYHSRYVGNVYLSLDAVLSVNDMIKNAGHAVYKKF